MATYTFTPKSTTQLVFWHDPSIWIGGIVPNGPEADVVLPTATLTAGGIYLSSIVISDAEAFSVLSLDMANQGLDLNGQLSVLGSVSIHSGATLDLGSGILSAGSLINEGNLQRSGQVLVAGMLANNSSIYGYGLTVTAVGLSNSGTLWAGPGNLVVNVPAGGFTNFDGTTLTGGTYVAGDSTFAAGDVALLLNVGGPIRDAAATITLDRGGAIESFDPISGTYLPLQATLRSIAPTGVLSLAGQSYNWGALSIDGVLALSGNATLNADQLTVGATGQIKGWGSISAPVSNSGLIIASGFRLDIEGPVTGPGRFVIDPGSIIVGLAPKSSTLELSTPISQDVVFSNNVGTLIIDDPASFTGTIAPSSLIDQLSTGDVIILNGLSFAGLEGHSYEGDSTAGVLSLHYASGTTNLNIIGDFNAGSFNFSAGPQFLTTSPPSLQITVGGTVKLLNDTGPSSTDYITFDPTITQKTYHSAAVQLVIDGTPLANSIWADAEGVWNYTPVGLADGAHTIVATAFTGGYRGSSVAVGTASITFTLDTQLNTDIYDDLVFQHNTTGGLYGWELNASGLAAGGDLGVPGSTWHAADASGDYNGDGFDDIIFQNTTNGEVYFWLQNGFAISSQSSLGVPGVAWQIVASGDINGDGNDDLLFQNTGTGEVYAWEQNGLTTLATASLGVPGTQWAVIAAADLNGTGGDELVFQNVAANGGGEIYVWQQNGFATTSTFSMGAPGAAWELQGSGDFDNDGHEDFVFQNANTGEVYIWLINSSGNGIGSQGSAGSAAGWSIVGTGDYNGDFRSDLAFQNDATGAVYLWFMNGTVVGSGQDLGIASGWNVI